MLRRTSSLSAAVAHLAGPGQLKVINGQLAFKRHGDDPIRLDPTALTYIYCYGEVSVTGAAIEILFRHGVQTAWLSPAGARCRGRLAWADSQTTLNRVRQHRVFADPACAREWAKKIVSGKIEAMVAAARHYQRHGNFVGSLLADLAGFSDRLSAAKSADTVRGLEGAASGAWFRCFAGLLKDPWVFASRTRRPPSDPTNALLSLAYTWLLNRTNARLEASGYEVYLGGLHEYRPGRPSLACDMMEPLRVPVVDRWVIATCNQGELMSTDFQPVESGGFHLHSTAIGKTLCSWEKHWQEGRFDDALQYWLNTLATFLRERDRPEKMPAPAGDDL